MNTCLLVRNVLLERFVMKQRVLIDAIPASIVHALLKSFKQRHIFSVRRQLRKNLVQPLVAVLSHKASKCFCQFKLLLTHHTNVVIDLFDPKFVCFDALWSKSTIVIEAMKRGCFEPEPQVTEIVEGLVCVVVDLFTSEILIS